MRRSTVVAAAALAVLASTVSEGWAVLQHARDSLAAGGQAYEEGNFERAAALLGYGLDPTAGPQDSVWVVSLQKLTHALIEIDRGPLATLWLRWALRHHGRLRANDTDFPPAVFTALADAALFVQRAQSDDSLADTHWEWPDSPVSSVALGAVRVTSNLAPGQTLDVVLTLGGLVTVGELTPGQVRYLPPGTYTVMGSAEGLREVRVEREVLPGVVTDLHVMLQPAVPQRAHTITRACSFGGNVAARPNRAGALLPATLAETILPAGLVVDCLLERSPLAVGDTLVAVDGRRIRTPSDLSVALRTKRPGDTVQVQLRREGQDMAVAIQLADLKALR